MFQKSINDFRLIIMFPESIVVVRISKIEYCVLRNDCHWSGSIIDFHQNRFARKSIFTKLTICAILSASICLSGRNRYEAKFTVAPGCVGG